MARRSPTQLAALRLVAGGKVKVVEHRVGRRRVVSPDGRITLTTLNSLETAGLVYRDQSTSYFEGQAIRVTDAGRAELTASTPEPVRPPSVPSIEIVVLRTPDGDTTLSYFVDGNEVEPSELGISEYHVDPGRSGADREWQEAMEENARETSPAAAAYIRGLVSDYS